MISYIIWFYYQKKKKLKVPKAQGIEHKFLITISLLLVVVICLICYIIYKQNKLKNLLIAATMDDSNLQNASKQVKDINTDIKKLSQITNKQEFIEAKNEIAKDSYNTILNDIEALKEQTEEKSKNVVNNKYKP